MPRILVIRRPLNSHRVKNRFNTLYARKFQALPENSSAAGR